MLFYVAFFTSFIKKKMTLISNFAIFPFNFIDKNQIITSENLLIKKKKMKRNFFFNNLPFFK